MLILTGDFLLIAMKASAPVSGLDIVNMGMKVSKSDIFQTFIKGCA